MNFGAIDMTESGIRPLHPGMAFAVDGGITVPGDFGARVGDTIVVTEDGTECVTEFPRALEVL